MDKSFDALFDAHEDAKLGHARHLSLYFGPDRMTVCDHFPGIRGELLDAEREALIFDVHAKHSGFDDVALFVRFRRVFDLLGPVQIGNMHEPVYTFFDAQDKKASYGTYNILWLIEWCRGLGLPYLYLGYWIAESAKMAYKQNFLPQEYLVDNQWCATPKPPEK